MQTPFQKYRNRITFSHEGLWRQCILTGVIISGKTELKIKTLSVTEMNMNMDYTKHADLSCVDLIFCAYSLFHT